MYIPDMYIPYILDALKCAEKYEHDMINYNRECAEACDMLDEHIGAAEARAAIDYHEAQVIYYREALNAVEAEKRRDLEKWREECRLRNA